MSVPAVYAETVHLGRDGVRTVRVRCPFAECRHHWHIHGWPAWRADVGSRVADCGFGSYRVYARHLLAAS